MLCERSTSVIFPKIDKVTQVYCVSIVLIPPKKHPKQKTKKVQKYVQQDDAVVINHATGNTVTVDLKRNKYQSDTRKSHNIHGPDTIDFNRFPTSKSRKSKRKVQKQINKYALKTQESATNLYGDANTIQFRNSVENAKKSKKIKKPNSKRPFGDGDVENNITTKKLKGRMYSNNNNCSDDCIYNSKKTNKIIDEKSVKKLKRKIICLCGKYSQKCKNTNAERISKIDHNQICFCNVVSEGNNKLLSLQSKNNRIINELTCETCIKNEVNDKNTKFKKTRYKNVHKNLKKERKCNNKKLRNDGNQTEKYFFDIKIDSDKMCVLNSPIIREKVKALGEIPTKCICPSHNDLVNVYRSNACKIGFKCKNIFDCNKIKPIIELRLEDSKNISILNSREEIYNCGEETDEMKRRTQKDKKKMRKIDNMYRNMQQGASKISKSKRKQYKKTSYRKASTAAKKRFIKDMKRRDKVARQIAKIEHKRRLKEIKKIQLELQAEGGEESNFLAYIIYLLYQFAVAMLKLVIYVLYNCITAPLASLWYIKEKLINPGDTLRKFKMWFLSIFQVQKMRMLKKVNESRTMSVLCDTIKESSVYQAIGPKGATKEEQKSIEAETKRRRKRIQKRDHEALYGCRHILLTTLRRTPLLWIYHICPFLYPHALAMLAFLRNLCNLILFLLAIIVWTPCIVSFEMCRAVMCCFLCTH